ncbi:NAD-glutamate dehydrogenase [Halovibrio salipaludis]|uniref:NAD-glutamate dehydrogenase n=1 Tax=Halovibrio salipaludis TaxID=2032626 RepID=A0A2A2F9G3_9GAMM|nr:NAD-glutamate dehydrogenase [Halovibrio salipaludis]PAU81374.1 NAD-glutamate dehydrogenase [Halovibrio salipaludis]
MNEETFSTMAEFQQKLDGALRERLPADQADRISDFAQRYFEHMPFAELVQQRFLDAYGAVLSAWEFVQQGPGQESRVWVFNPDLEKDGWESSHTVMFVLHPNIPFLIDSMRMEVNARELNIHTIHYTILNPERDGKGDLVRLNEAVKKPLEPGEEALIVMEVDRHSDSAALSALRADVEQVLGEVRIAVSDFPHMRDKATAILDELADPPKTLSSEEVSEARAFLEWLVDDRFTFLGYDEYDFVRENRRTEIRQVPDSELGILRTYNERPSSIRMKDMPRQTREAMTDSSSLFIFGKSAQRSRIHRPAYPDYIAIKKLDEKGRVVGERRFLGLYTSRVYHERPDEIPLLRRKIEYVLSQSGFPREDYAGKELDQILTVYPRDQLFQIGGDELVDVAKAILYIQERRKIRLFMREDVYGQFVTCLAFVPRELYSTQLRVSMQNAIVRALDAEGIDFTTYFSESVLARTQFTVRVQPQENRVLPVEELQQKLVELARSWQDTLQEALVEHHGEEIGTRLSACYENAFPAGYRDMFSARRAAIDVEYLDRIHETGRMAMSFYRDPEESANTLHFKLFHPHQQLPLSDVIPVFENIGFRVIGEHPFEITDRSGNTHWIHDFALRSRSGEPIDIERIRPIFESLFTRVWHGEGENDHFNQLLLAGYLDWRSISLLRAYARYMQQIRISNSQTFIAGTLARHDKLVSLLLQFFDVRFNPERYQSERQCEAAQKKIAIEFGSGLDEVPNLSEDRVLRLFLELMQATTRTNFYQEGSNGDGNCISLKFDPSQLADLPRPRPVYEIFVYSPQVEGVHLRGGKVARGGLRWSDRFEDYRTEILGLVKAQQVKNAVIVPVGAKGGFVAKQIHRDADRQEVQAAGRAAYSCFIRGLLDVTDNFVDGEVIPPKGVIRHDEDDYYLVVAPDKGTATFSDLANEISNEYGFWMEDGFASGGSYGYDHKKMGITAKGAWVSVERHFRELGVNTDTDEFSVVGIGDMAGDVFGNGMLLSRKIRLVAAFNHQHIFLDPDPDTEASFRERERLFALPGSSWEEYDTGVISEGGGVFSRASKSIPLSQPVKEMLGTRSDHMPPNMLISHLLQMRHDLLWLGGIGTFVKSRQESHGDVGDKANDGLRVDGAELGSRVVGEGGNLGMSQAGRVEFARHGGRCNTDFIDNSGGVDCSDREVNMKILLNRLVAQGDLTFKQRNEFLTSMTEDVSRLVLENNYRQTQAISIANSEGAERLEEYRRLMVRYENRGLLDRGLENLPDEEALSERQLNGQGLTRPELSVLIAVVKADLKQVLVASDLPEDPGIKPMIREMFPSQLVERFDQALEQHQLRREIIATRVANDLVNHMGMTFVERLQQSTGAALPSIARAYLISKRIYRLDYWWQQVEALDYRIPSGLQIELQSELMRLVRRGARWLLRNRRSEIDMPTQVERFQTRLDAMAADLKSYIGERALDVWQQERDRLTGEGVPEPLAGVVAGSGHLLSGLGIIDAREETGLDLKEVAHLYFAVGDELELDWFANAISALVPRSHWEALARESFREDLNWQQRALTTGILRSRTADTDLQTTLQAWASEHAGLIERWHGIMGELRSQSTPEYAMFSVALRELLDLAQSTVHVGVSG